MVQKRYSRPNLDIYSKTCSKSKRSQAHVEMILATTLFIGFLVFVFVFLNSSLKTTTEIPTEKIQRLILEEVQEEVGKLSVILGSSDPPITDPCFDLGEIESEYGIDFRSVMDPLNTKRYTIYYGGFLEKNTLPSCPSDRQDFTLGPYLEEEIIIEDKIEELVARYTNDYSGLKQELGLDNFAFEFRDINSKALDRFSVRGKIPDSVDIISKDFPIRTINNTAQISELILNIKAWN